MQWPGYACLTWWLRITASLASAGSQPVSNTRIFSSRRTRFWHPMAWPIVPQPCSSKCYSWNHDTVQFHSEYSPDGRLFARWSDTGSLVQVWDTRTGQSVGKFPTFSVYAMTLSPTLIQHSLGDTHRSLASLQKHNIYTGHLFTWVSCRGYTLRLYKMEPIPLMTMNLNCKTWQMDG